jgi:hypothetical protein
LPCGYQRQRISADGVNWQPAYVSPSGKAT